MLSGIPSFLPHFLTISRVQYVSELIQRNTGSQRRFHPAFAGVNFFRHRLLAGVAAAQRRLFGVIQK